MPHGGLIEQAGRDLVEQRLERVVVVPVHEHDVDVTLAQLLGGPDPAESPAQDYDAQAAARFSSSVHVAATLKNSLSSPLTRRG
jgi:hypothetical protein